MFGLRFALGSRKEIAKKCRACYQSGWREVKEENKGEITNPATAWV
jgi:hypothetical protein